MDLSAVADPFSISILPILGSTFSETFVLLSTCSPQQVEQEFV